MAAKNECARTDNLFSPISQVCTRGVTLIKKNSAKKNLRRSQFSKKREGGRPARYDDDHQFNGFLKPSLTNCGGNFMTVTVIFLVYFEHS